MSIREGLRTHISPKSHKPPSLSLRRKKEGGKIMADDQEEPPLAIRIDQTVEEPSQSDQEKPQNDYVSVGVTVITGYLGAGKSTLVNYILNAQHGKRIAVILNEFGEEIGVERSMINEGESGALVEEWVELANGCVCCTVKHSLVQALEQLVQMKKKLDHILLETTGLANPAPLASVLWLDDQLESSVKLDSIVTVVDAKNLRFQLNRHHDSSSFPEAFLQIAFAVRLWIEEILWDKKYGMDVYRCKGVLRVGNSDQLHTLQAVREIYEIVPTRQWRNEEKQMNRIVFIGHNLDENILIDTFRGCILESTWSE
ncbi:hypothetical protein ES332_D13G096700v1 [Gossypium tomentosum]|uniref:CobW C-terminal domain-containing protein n=1 Tax=Gossypium tomentosum TaxID=34277 RepID=A0A5D2HV20_GOSTO|nr:hypothetical protein ES332_D13G096700v1 [Gossypium tomentosum]